MLEAGFSAPFIPPSLRWRMRSGESGALNLSGLAFILRPCEAPSVILTFVVTGPIVAHSDYGGVTHRE